jgi:hypothetical protein
MDGSPTAKLFDFASYIDNKISGDEIGGNLHTLESVGAT